MKNQMMSAVEAGLLIQSGKILMIAGDEGVLRSLPNGNWIGGTSVYFMTETGGREDRENVFVTEISEAVAHKTRYIPTSELSSIASQRFGNGATFVIVPAMSSAHVSYATDAAGYEDIFAQPVMGWIAGVHLDEIGATTAKVVDGATGEMYDDGIVVLHTEFTAGRAADVDIINLFEQDQSADELIFEEGGFELTNVIVNGEKRNFAEYIAENEINTELPLVANYAGAMINASFQAVDADARKVNMYAPIMPGTEYRIAKGFGDYTETFASVITEGGENALSCNCILNYVYGQLEGKSTGNFTGPITFGEIAYVLLNQTLVRVSAVEAEAVAVA
ncbi:MAG: hypothetical protein AAF830_12405 [Pseudomonadota bacterium]